MSQSEILLKITPVSGESFHIVLPADFMKLPPSVNKVFTDKIINAWLDNTIVPRYKYEYVDKRAAWFRPSRICINAEHKTDGMISVYPPANMVDSVGTTANDLASWVENNLYDIKQWNSTWG